MEESKKSSNGIKILIVLLILLMIVAGVLVAIKFIQGNKIKQTQTSAGVEENKEPEKEVIKLPTTFAGKDRPIAVMIDNNINAMPQAGLLEADLVYEIIVEGGETRMMAVLKGKDVEKIGPVRSSRHYFLDYALENDAIYVHFGWSPQAESDISTMGVNNINGLYYDGSYFWRVSEKYAPHNAVISTKNILKVAENNEYRTTSEQKPVLNYVADEIELEDGKEAETITIIYQIVGFSTRQLAKLNEGDEITDFVGPLGVPTDLHKSNHVVGIAGGVGSAPLYPQLKKLAEMGVDVDVIIGGREAQYVLWADKFKAFCKNVYVMTDDGSLGEKGFGTVKLLSLIHI